MEAGREWQGGVTPFRKSGCSRKRSYHLWDCLEDLEKNPLQGHAGVSLGLRPSWRKGEQKPHAPRWARRPGGQKRSLLPGLHMMPGPQGHSDSRTQLCLLWGRERLLLTEQSDCCQMWAPSQLLHNSGFSSLHTVQLKGALEVGL